MAETQDNFLIFCDLLKKTLPIETREARFVSEGQRRVVIPAKSKQVGDLVIWDHGDEITIEVGDIYHTHFSFSSQEKKLVLEAINSALLFLKELLSSRLIIDCTYKGDQVISSSIRTKEKFGASKLVFPGWFLLGLFEKKQKKSFLWSGLLENSESKYFENREDRKSVAHNSSMLQRNELLGLIKKKHWNITYSKEPKLIAYFDLLGISKFYLSGPTPEEFSEKLGDQFLSVMSEFCEHISVHILSDTGFIIPKDSSLENGTYSEEQFIKDSCKVFFKLVQKKVPFKGILTKGQYIALIPTELNNNRYPLNILPGGEVLAKCFDADKGALGGFPTGFYTDIETLSIPETFKTKKWKLVDIYKYIPASYLAGEQRVKFKESYLHLRQNAEPESSGFQSLIWDELIKALN